MYIHTLLTLEKLVNGARQVAHLFNPFGPTGPKGYVPLVPKGLYIHTYLRKIGEWSTTSGTSVIYTCCTRATESMATINQ
jgi:hypothetical protein